MGIGKSIRLFLVNGSPGGLMTAEIVNWTGQITSSPRDDLGELVKRADAQRTGIYLLLGDDPQDPGKTRAYVGEADAVSSRLQYHARPEGKGGKDFWERAVILTSKDANLTKAHARYLEARLITMARDAKRVNLENGTAPEPPRLPEADISDMEDFIRQANIVLPVLGVQVFRPTRPPAPTILLSNSSETSNIEKSPAFEILRPRYGIAARAQVVDGEFIVFEGSTVRSAWVAREGGYKELRERLEGDGTILNLGSGNEETVTKDVVFSSPSAAAAIVLGRSSNGRTAWKIVGSDSTYADWQEQQFIAETGASLS